jgi:lipoate-protein ligase B
MTSNIKILHHNQWHPNTIDNDIIQAAYSLSTNSAINAEFWIYSCNNVPGWLSGGENSKIETYNGLTVQPTSIGGGGVSYLGPGILAIVMILEPRFLHENRNLGINDIFKILNTTNIEYVKQEHGLELFYNEADPGLYDIDGAKIGSVDSDISKSSYIVVSTLNFRSDLAQFNNLPICGVENRKMANILKTGTSITDEELAGYGSAIVQRLITSLYSSYNIIE